MDYQSGFGNRFETEAEKGSLPRGQNSPKQPPRGLVAEQISGTAFVCPRAYQLHSWLYRIHPSPFHGPVKSYSHLHWKTFLSLPRETNPQPMRWLPLPEPQRDCDFIDGVYTLAVHSQGGAVHLYSFNQNMGERYFYNADGELLVIPEKGGVQVNSEFGDLQVEPQEIVVIPRGVKFQINSMVSSWSRGYMVENPGVPFTLPELGPLGSNGLAHPRDFLYPRAKYENKSGSFTLVSKFSHSFWQYEQGHHPLDVVAWHGNYAPYKYDLRKFNTMGTVSYDHPDPSIYTVLTSPSPQMRSPHMDFVIFPPRWLVGEETFRPPYYHRNIMSEYMGLIHGVYDAKKRDQFVPGGSSLHNCMTPHGPDTQTFNKGIQASEEPYKVEDTMAFMIESSLIYHPTPWALDTELRDKKYISCWQGFKPSFYS